jgi:nucleoside recognition membrane protein YjiH
MPLAHSFLVDVVGTVGVLLLLLAFFLQLFGWLDPKGVPYLVMNLVGGGLACAASWMLPFWPFVVLEGTWAVVAAVGLGRRLAPG